MNGVQNPFEIPLAWEKFDLEALEGVVMVVGATDTGKTTFARYLFLALNSLGYKAGLLDGDPGQSSLGPPATLSLAFSLETDDDIPDAGQVRRYFVGSITPQGHMLPVVVGGAMLARSAFENGVQTVIYDTSGLVDPQMGGLALKMAKIDLLRPQVVFAIQRDEELEPLLTPLRRSRRLRVVTLQPVPNLQRRGAAERRHHRTQQYVRYFHPARHLSVEWHNLAVFPLPVFRLHRLLALEDANGLVAGLGIVTDIDRPRKRVTLLTPLENLDGVDALRLGDILLDPDSFQDEKIYK
jgi:polynucleotide 5'-hydroxyl-kinase GRC3/NOL9